MRENEQVKVKPHWVMDLSPAVVSLARELDRLPPGEYIVRLEKPDKGFPWHAEIVKGERLRRMDLWR